MQDKLHYTIHDRYDDIIQLNDVDFISGDANMRHSRQERRPIICTSWCKQILQKMLQRRLNLFHCMVPSYPRMQPVVYPY